MYINVYVMQESIYKGEGICRIVTDIKSRPHGYDVVSVEICSGKLLLLSCQEHLSSAGAYYRADVGSTPFVATVFYYPHNY